MAWVLHGGGLLVCNAFQGPCISSEFMFGKSSSANSEQNRRTLRLNSQESSLTLNNHRSFETDIKIAWWSVTSFDSTYGMDLLLTQHCWAVLFPFIFACQVGACIVDAQNRIVGVGYNGMPIGCSDDLLPWGKSSPNRLNTKYMYGKASFTEYFILTVTLKSRLRQFMSTVIRFKIVMRYPFFCKNGAMV